MFTRNFKGKPEIEVKADTKILLEIERKNPVDGISDWLSLGSYVEEVLDDNHILIQMPMRRGYYYTPPNTPVLMYLFAKLRMFSLMVQYVERVERGKLMYAKMRLLSDIQPNQRRACFRLECSLPVMVERTDQTILPAIKTGKNCEAAADGQAAGNQEANAQMVNFSDGGMLFATNDDYEVGENVTLSFALTLFSVDGEIPETIDGVVLRVESPYEIGGAYKRNIAVKFTHKCKKQKDRFYRFIVEQQREVIKRQAEENILLSP